MSREGWTATTIANDLDEIEANAPRPGRIWCPEESHVAALD